jgi:hypothetical protein
MASRAPKKAKGTAIIIAKGKRQLSYSAARIKNMEIIPKQFHQIWL